MITPVFLLVVAAFVVAVLNGIGKAPLWPAVLLVALAQFLIIAGLR